MIDAEGQPAAGHRAPVAGEARLELRAEGVHVGAGVQAQGVQQPELAGAQRQAGGVRIETQQAILNRHSAGGQDGVVAGESVIGGLCGGRPRDETQQADQQDRAPHAWPFVQG